MTSNFYVLLQKYFIQTNYILYKNMCSNRYFIFYLQNSTVPISNVLFEKCMICVVQGGEAMQWGTIGCHALRYEGRQCNKVWGDVMWPGNGLWCDKGKQQGEVMQWGNAATQWGNVKRQCNKAIQKGNAKRQCNKARGGEATQQGKRRQCNEAKRPHDMTRDKSRQCNQGRGSNTSRGGNCDVFILEHVVKKCSSGIVFNNSVCVVKQNEYSNIFNF